MILETILIVFNLANRVTLGVTMLCNEDQFRDPYFR